MQTTQASPWQLVGSEATLADHGLKVDVALPSMGVRASQGTQFAEPTHGLTESTGVLLGITPARGDGELMLDDVYIRGADLVARYQPTSDFPFRTEVYWRWHAAPTAGFSIIISVETDLLDTYPEVIVRSRIDCDSLQTFVANTDAPNKQFQPSQADQADAVLFASQPAWLQAIHPSDWAEAVYFPETTAESTAPAFAWSLFSQFLEKGVIRRARLAAFLLGDGADHAAASAAYANFASQPPPLTV